MKFAWFKAKRHGFGWTPAAWQGWLVVFLYVFFIAFFFIQIDRHSHSASDTLINFIPRAILLTIVLFFICYKTRIKENNHE